MMVTMAMAVIGDYDDDDDDDDDNDDDDDDADDDDDDNDVFIDSGWPLRAEMNGLLDTDVRFDLYSSTPAVAGASKLELKEARHRRSFGSPRSPIITGRLRRS